MHRIHMFLSFLIFTIVWNLVITIFVPIVSKIIFDSSLKRSIKKDIYYNSKYELDQFYIKKLNTARIQSLMIVSVIFGFMAGFLNFPLIGISISKNIWGWISFITVIGLSWVTYLWFPYGL